MAETIVKASKANKIKNPTEDRILYAAVGVILTLFILCILYPVIFIISASFSEGTEVQLGHVYLLPVKPTLDGYKAVFSHKNVLTGFRNTFFYTFVGTAINVVITLLCAYPLSRRDLPFRGFFTFLFVFTMFFSGGLIPSYLLVSKLKMINTIWALLLPGAMSVYNMIITRSFFVNTVPQDLLEAAEIDGCSDARYFFAILLPLSQAVIAVISLYYAVAHWNAYFSALIYLRDPNLQPLQLILRNILLATRVSLSEFEDPDLMEGKIGLEYLLKYALIVVSCGPIIALYPFVQKFFMKGVMLGSVKG
uniref:CUT1 family carbohydrate ABC transporter membrane protein 2 n=1 Tax=uncultured bacterium Contig99 TaxID=1393639 RepID=W0FI50_9BACT|nr:CUT1 family carbohydrate ABC transporter membrane protein 2 [uncultured bacterium Contig99]